MYRDSCRKERLFSQYALGLTLAGLFSFLPQYGASAASAPDGYVSRKEYNQLKNELAEIKRELHQIQSEKAAQAPSGTGASSSALSKLQQQVDEIKSVAEETKPGTTKFMLTGGASASFTAPNNAASNFGATFSPIFLWELSDRLFFESEVEFELENSDTKINLEYAHLTYRLGDYVTLGAGKFLNPMNIFVERYEPKWINKLPDTPLAVYDGILPETNVGAQIRGVIPVGPTRFNFAAYVSNTPILDTGADNAGSLEFNNYSSLSDNKAVGGRIGFMPWSQLEVGYGIQGSTARAENGQSAQAILQSVDLSGAYDSDLLKGRFQLLGQYAWSDVGSLPYQTDNGVLNFSNKRNGGYLQLSYRLKKWDSDLMNRFELVVRGDRSEAPTGAPGAFDEKRLTFGIDYWLTASTVLKAAYEIDNRSNGEPNQNAFLLQVATGL